jgi:primosomal protein N' (replication factor Y)
MTAEFEAGHRSMFSRPLLAALSEVQTRGEKAVLLLNRRGYAAFLLCRECGYVPSCDNCSISLTYHEVGERLTCHHCDAVRPVPATCPKCGSPYLRQFGAGTQRVESELATAVPGLPVVRMDADTTTGRGGHERALATFEALDSGVLLGTQMIAKGLDYPEVTLVGVVNADTTLHMPDFRAGERTWQLLEQVAGRAGRGPKGGQVIVQTYWPDHPAIRAVAVHDGAGFYAMEAQERRDLGYPPYGALANVIIRAPDNRTAAKAAGALSDAFAARVPDGWHLVGPAPAPIARLKGIYRWHLLVKAPAGARIAPVAVEALKAATIPAESQCAVDIDPTDLL